MNEYQKVIASLIQYLDHDKRYNPTQYAKAPVDQVIRDLQKLSKRFN